MNIFTVSWICNTTNIHESQQPTKLLHNNLKMLAISLEVIVKQTMCLCHHSANTCACMMLQYTSWCSPLVTLHYTHI